MPKFIKDNSKEVNESKPVKTIDREKEILSPFYFPPIEDQMRQKEVASMFGRTVQTICNWTESNKIPYFRLGKHPIYSRKQLVLFASKNQNLILDKKV